MNLIIHIDGRDKNRATEFDFDGIVIITITSFKGI